MLSASRGKEFVSEHPRMGQPRSKYGAGSGQSRCRHVNLIQR